MGMETDHEEGAQAKGQMDKGASDCAALVGKIAMVFKMIYNEVKYRSGGAGAIQARAEFKRCVRNTKRARED